MLTRMAEYSTNLKTGYFLKLIGFIAAALCIFTGVCLAFFYLWGNDLLSLIYNTDLKDYIPELLIIFIGALFGSLAYLLSVALTSLRITRIQLYIFLVNLVCAAVLSLLLIPRAGLFGASLSYLFIMLVQLILYLIVFLYAIFSRKGKIRTFE